MKEIFVIKITGHMGTFGYYSQSTDTFGELFNAEKFDEYAICVAIVGTFGGTTGMYSIEKYFITK